MSYLLSPRVELYDYDFLIDNILFQVKTIIPSGAFAKSNLEKIEDRKAKLQNGEHIQKTEVKEEILSKKTRMTW